VIATGCIAAAERTDADGVRALSSAFDRAGEIERQIGDLIPDGTRSPKRLRATVQTCKAF
jgi:hypothetical protein